MSKILAAAKFFTDILIDLKRLFLPPKCRCGERREYSSGMGWKCSNHVGNSNQKNWSNRIGGENQ